MPDPNDASQVLMNPGMMNHSNTTVQDRAVRELYVGNTPGIVTESLLTSFVGAACVQAKICPVRKISNHNTFDHIGRPVPAIGKD